MNKYAVMKASFKKRILRQLKGLRAEYTIMDPLKEIEKGQRPDTKYLHPTSVTQLNINNHLNE